MPYSPSDLPKPSEQSAYVAGQFVEGDAYDDPQGSQQYQPSKPQNPAPPVDGEQRLYQDPDDADYALVEPGVEGVGTNYGVTNVREAEDVSTTEDNEYVVVPDDPDGTLALLREMGGG